MDQFDRSPEDVSFDLDAEEFSLESILDEYKDFQTDAPAPRPQPAYRSRPVTAEMIEEEEAEDAAAEDILMSTELDSALEILLRRPAQTRQDAPPHEDHDVKRYQPKRQRDHATEEEIEKWNETKANAKRLAKKGISGLKHFASKLSEVVPDEPVESEEAPPAEDAAIPVSAPPEEILAACRSKFKCIPTGLAHGTVTVVHGGLPVEVTAFRKEGTYSDHRHPDRVAYTSRLEEDLARVVRAITGEEDPEVLVTLEDTGENVYAADQAWNTQEGGAQNSREEESTYILLKDRDGGQSALPVTQRQPEVRGVVIVSSRAGDPAVREQLTQAAVTALDISSARVLVTGGGSVRRNGAYDAVTASLEAAGIPFTELSGVQANPRSGKVYEGIDLVRRTGADFLLALGGGSVIDTAKAIGFGALYKGDFWDFFTGAAKIEKTLPVGVVLTISAAGSEGSDSCVITQERGNLKWGCPKTDVIRPKFAVLNPRFTCSLPAYQTASGAVDMMAHIMERYFTNTPDVGLTDRLCEALLKTVLDAAPKAIADPNDYAARADLMWAGMLAHNNSCGVGREQDWASHQIEHELSAFYDCAHGAGLAVILPAWMEYVLPHDPVRLAQFAVRVFGCEMNFADPEATARQGIEKLCLFFHSLGMPITFDELGAKAKDIPDMVAHRAEKPGGFPFGGFVKIQPADMEAILRLAAGEAQ
mgnify:CR=1 FL=1